MKIVVTVVDRPFVSISLGETDAPYGADEYSQDDREGEPLNWMNEERHCRLPCVVCKARGYSYDAATHSEG